MSGIETTSPGRRAVARVRWTLQLVEGGVLAAAVILFGVDAPLFPALSVFVLAGLFNLLLFNGERIDRRLTDREILLALGADVAQLSAILMMTGGLANPFAIFLLAPTILGAALLKPRSLATLSLLSGAAMIALTVQHPPLRFADGDMFQPSAGVRLGILTAYLAALIAIAVMIRRLTEDARQRAEALAQTQRALEEQQRVSAIGAMAAAIAHELATPLATIKLTAAELRRDIRDNPEALEDAVLIAEQAERCRDILAELTEIRAPEKEHIRTAPILAVLQEAAGAHAERGVAIAYRFNGTPLDRPGAPIRLPEAPRRPELIHGLRNLIQNAVDFARSQVFIDIDATEKELKIVISDDGEGFSAEILERLGEPFATTRGQASSDGPNAYAGMGLGVFIAISLLERTGAHLRFDNSPAALERQLARQRGGRAREAGPLGERSGAVVTAKWPLSALTSRPPSPIPSSPSDPAGAEVGLRGQAS